ncbi:MAG: 3'(2'),5'-bisphosphate nucleotidase CysQ [Patescibacteria group bacterium]
MANHLLFIPSERTSLAIKAATKAGDAILEIYTSNFSSEFKEDKSPITEADKRSNEIIEQLLSPGGYPILSEESADSAERLSAKTIWIVDPLDGTSDFIERTGEFSVHIALVTDGVPVLGVVYQPTTKTFFVAEQGRGAYRGDGEMWKHLKASNVSEMSQVRFIMSRHHLQPKEREFILRLGITRFEQRGSCGLKIAAVACGAADAYVTFSSKICQWDTAPGYCILAEAGGRLTDLHGADVVYTMAGLNHAGGTLVTNGIIHSAIVEHLKTYAV